MQSTVILHPDGTAEGTGVSVSVPWWSFTKTVLAAVMLRLSEQSRVGLTEPVAGKRYTPLHLLRHEAGLPDYGDLAGYHTDVAAGRPPWSPDELWQAVEADRLRYEPGQGWAYSNIGYMEIARLIEGASELSLADALADLVFDPAGLVTARLAANPADLTGVCMGDVEGYHPGWVYHGLIVGTVTDAARLLDHLLSGKLLTPASLARMLDARPLPQFRSHLHPDPAYGAGLMLPVADPHDNPVGHSGGGPGSRIAVYAQRERTCAMWAATTSGVDPEAEVFRTLRSSHRPR